jgi:hypothetical protein
MDPNGPKWASIDPNGHEWTSMDPNGPERFEMDRNRCFWVDALRGRVKKARVAADVQASDGVKSLIFIV